MIKNYLKIAWRNITKNKAHSFINIAGLSVGLACSLLILLWVQNELSVDAFHKSSSQLYIVYERQYYDHKEHGSYNTPGPLAGLLKTAIPEVQYASSHAFGRTNTFQVGDKILKMEGNSATADYFKMFNFPMLQGNAQNALNSPVSLAISRKMADVFYGSPEAAIGKTIRYENNRNLTVTAVFEDMPQNTSERFDYITNWKVFTDENPWYLNFGNEGPDTYVLLRPDANPAKVEKKMISFFDTYSKTDRKTATFIIDLALQRYDQKYLHGDFDEQGHVSGGRIEYVRLFSIVAVFILLIACINFMNLTTARSVKRAREIGVRKVVGALRSSLIQQFISESMLITAAAVLISLALLVLLLPFFNNITQKQILLPFSQPAFWIKIIVITLVTGLVSGSYPALFLSSFNPVRVLKGSIKLNSGTTVLRKGLVVFQFVLSIVLISATIIISRQMNYVEGKDLGYDKENLVYLPMEGDLSTRYNVFKQEALQLPGIQAVTRTTNTPTDIHASTGGVDWIGKDPNVDILFTQASVGYDFVKTMKLKILAGRDFSRDFPSDSVGYLVNQLAAKRLGYKDPIGQPLTFWGKKGKIIGLLQDFHLNSLHEQITPLILRAGEHEAYGNILVRTESGKTREAIASLQSLHRQMSPAFPFTYYFSDAEYQKLYQNEQVVEKLSNSFSFLAIFISCLGLLGLAMFTAEQRVREFGIRKVLGASVRSLFSLLSSEFLLLVLIALLIASPIAWYAMSLWLRTFEYSAPIQWWMFALSGGLIIAIALLTVSFQAIKSALVNPVKSLRAE
jgi:putative ABC transport system permease protein